MAISTNETTGVKIMPMRDGRTRIMSPSGFSLFVCPDDLLKKNWSVRYGSTIISKIHGEGSKVQSNALKLAETLAVEVEKPSACEFENALNRLRAKRTNLH